MCGKVSFDEHGKFNAQIDSILKGGWYDG